MPLRPRTLPPAPPQEADEYEQQARQAQEEALALVRRAVGPEHARWALPPGPGGVAAQLRCCCPLILSLRQHQHSPAPLLHSPPTPVGRQERLREAAEAEQKAKGLERDAMVCWWWCKKGGGACCSPCLLAAQGRERKRSGSRSGPLTTLPAR